MGAGWSLFGYSLLLVLIFLFVFLLDEFCLLAEVLDDLLQRRIAISVRSVCRGGRPRGVVLEEDERGRGKDAPPMPLGSLRAQ